MLLRELAGEVVDAVGVDELHRPRQAAVEEPALRRAHGGVGGAAEKVVGEVVASPLAAEDPPPPELVHRSHETVDVEVARLAQEVEGEVAPHGRGEPRHIAGRRRDLLEPAPQHGTQVVDAEALGEVRVVLHDVGGLDDEQRVPARRRLQERLVRGRERPAEQGGGELARALAVERRQRDPL